MTSIDRYFTTRLDDDVTGSTGDDWIRTYEGDDTIEGLAGADEIYGNAGNDTFVYSSLADSTSTDTDIIYDFTDGDDVFDMSALSYTDITDFSISFDGTHTVIENTTDNFEINLVGDHTSDLDNSDFVF